MSVLTSSSSSSSRVFLSFVRGPCAAAAAREGPCAAAYKQNWRFFSVGSSHLLSSGLQKYNGTNNPLLYEQECAKDFGSSSLPQSKLRRLRFLADNNTIAESSRASSYLSEIKQLSTNIPQHIRETLGVKPPIELSSSSSSPRDLLLFPSSSGPVPALRTIAAHATALLTGGGGTTTRTDEDSTTTTSSVTHYTQLVPYQNRVTLIPPQSPKQTVAYHFSEQPIPREVAFRFPVSLVVDPVYAHTDRDLRLRAKPHALWQRLQGRVTLLLAFSGQPLAGLVTGVQPWARLLERERVLLQSLPKTGLPNNYESHFAAASTLFGRGTSSRGGTKISFSGTAGQSGGGSWQDKKHSSSDEEGHQDHEGLQRGKIENYHFDFSPRGSKKRMDHPQLLKLHCAAGWFSRRSHQLTKFFLRKQTPDEEMFDTFVYRGKWSRDLRRYRFT